MKLNNYSFTRRRIVAALALFAVLSAATAMFRGVGRWLVREDPLAHADAIVVLSGSMPRRAEAAAAVYRAGYAPEVWLTRPANPADELAAMGIRYVSEEDYNSQVLVHQGVPTSAIRILPDEIVDTEQEVDEISREMRSLGKSHVLIVTSSQHTRRVRALWQRLAARDQEATVRAAPEDPFDRDHWWRNTRDAYSVVREILGLMNTWAGLRVRPHSP
ncbi:MAG TPA: YdcF family protein [Candidatus Acidoferrum sp.]|nr:YdcF family protein [Candidatus Acidoferrum sp.]